MVGLPIEKYCARIGVIKFSRVEICGILRGEPKKIYKPKNLSNN
jgi:hypothetical protein